MARKSKKLDPQEQDEVKGDMTPMIDVVFLLLIFFLLTTKFIVPEKMISQLLPTNKGQASSSPPVVEPPADLNIKLYPKGFARGMGVEQMDTMWKDSYNDSVALLQVGGNPPIEIPGNKVSGGTQRQFLEPTLEGIYQYVEGHLNAAEDPTATARQEQRPVVIHCFSALSWKYALLAYDAVRQYERNVAGGRITSSQDLREAREVSFAPPRIRNYHTWELGNELWEIIHMN